MSRRFFVQTAIGDAPTVTLADAEAHHLLHVLRAKPGDAVTLFDGSGWEFDAEVTGTGRKQAELRITRRERVDRELPFQLDLIVALPRGDRQEWLVEKAVELGATRLVPLVTQRGVAQPTDKACLRLERAVIEASKQCRRNRLMEIAAPAPLATIAASAASEGEFRWFAHPGFGTPPIQTWSQLSAGNRASLLVGPEGGLADDEVATLVDHCWQGVRLGPRILRVETAALALVASVMLAVERD